MQINYSVGRSVSDQRPSPAVAGSFAEYQQAIKKLTKRINISPSDTKAIFDKKKKALNYIWGAMKNAKKGRNALNAGNRSVLWLDMDGCTLDAWEMLTGILGFYQCFAYTTASHEHPVAQGEQRWRIGFLLSREVTASEYAQLGPRIEQELMDCFELLSDLAIKWDRSVYEPSHMVFAPHEGAKYESFEGTVVDVDTLLASDNTPVIEQVDLPKPDNDDLTRLVDLQNINEQTFEDLRSAMFHPLVLADAAPRSDKHDAWAAMGCRLAWFIGTEFEDWARSIWLEWSAKGGGSQDDVDIAAKRWDDGKLKAERTGYQSIFALAQKKGWVNPGSERLKTAVVSEIELPVSQPHLGGYGTPGKFIVEGLIPVGVTAIYGASSTFKSYTALSISLRVALMEHRWAGRNIKGGSVLYIAAEGGSSIAPRVGAWADKYNNGNPIKNFYTLPRAVDLAEPKVVNGVLKEIKRIKDVTGEPVRMIVIDTLSQSMNSGDENSAGDMAKFLAGATKVASEIEAAVVFIHHTGKDSNKGMRGSSAAFANVDSVIKVERVGESVNLINEKQRTGPTQPTKSYHVPIVALPDYVIEQNESVNNDYTSTEGEIYEPVRLTTERVFEDVPFAEIITAFDDESKPTKRDTHEAWVWDQLDSAGGRIERAVLRERWKDLGMESNILRTVISRMKKSQGVSESSDGIIYDSILALEREDNVQKDDRKNFHSLQERQKRQNQPREEII
ncbi:AAA family ATPase [Arsenophonus nasoniae]|uniref:AAA family ATPase n=1 Tax=Arsenophonus nasoniae TaxID=638 RepID=A0AA95GK51_9GAMM|nr:AAA family ATPase [Arsenophonus nasoniae]WGM00528.1 AAA family ATPase [Arsenophonus nasoniae]